MVAFLSRFLSQISILMSCPPLTPPQHSQGMVYSAEYIKKKLEQEMILSQAFGRDLVPNLVYFTKNDGSSSDYFP